jgi:opacity protein-like surface antigen
MKKLLLGLVLGSCALLSTSIANAQSITTLFAGGNGGSAGGAVYFDVTVASNSLFVTGFDVNSGAAAGTNFGFQFWSLVGTRVGNEFNQGLWTLQATGSGVAAGPGLPSAVSLSNNVQLNASTTYGLALILAGVGNVNPVAHAYTNGDGTNQNYSNADITVQLGGASNIPFTAPLFQPRVWNGTINYSPVPEPGTFALLACCMVGYAARRVRRN